MRLFGATCREAQVANHLSGLVSNGHAPFGALPEPLAFLSEHGSRRCHCLGVRRRYVGENGSVVIAIVFVVVDVEEVARHGVLFAGRAGARRVSQSSVLKVPPADDAEITRWIQFGPITPEYRIYLL